MDHMIGRYIAIHPCDLEVQSLIFMPLTSYIVADGCHQHYPGKVCTVCVCVCVCLVAKLS